MASKGKKTKHVIQDTGVMSDSKYSKLLVEMGVGRPILPHEIDLKNLPEEEIAARTWTVQQMFDYLTYLQDFCGMPDNEPSIFIPKESKYVTKIKILSNFKGQKFGSVEKIDLLPHSKGASITVFLSISRSGRRITWAQKIPRTSTVLPMRG